MNKIKFLVGNSKKQYRLWQKIEKCVWYFLAFSAGYITFMVSMVATR